MKVVLVDNVLLLGNANFTSAGLDSFGEVALVIRDEKYLKLFEETFDKIYRQEHQMCRYCPKRGERVCGDAKDMLRSVLQEQLKKATEKRIPKAIEIINRLIKETEIY